MRSLAWEARAALQGGVLALTSVAIALAACEAALRLLHPRYELAANPPGEDSVRAYRLVSDPDTGVAHRVYYNNLGGRQSRNFPANSLDGVVNIAFFGDSQTENLYMPAQYSFSEPLDYLLNAAPAALPMSRGPRFNVLSFGRLGDGPARAYLRWRHLPVRRKLAHVVYMLVSNDHAELRGSLRSGTVRRVESGGIRVVGAHPAPAWKRLLAPLHLTYLWLDAWERLAGWPTNAAIAGDAAPPGKGRDPSHEETLGVFSELLRQWKREVEADGAVFHLVLLPNPTEGWAWASAAKWHRRLREDAVVKKEVGYFDLRACFSEHIPGFAYRDWRFANDPHWNPAANMVAATCLYRRLETALKLPERTDEELAGARHAYYRAFLDSSAWEGERYMPDAAWTGRIAAANAADGEAIAAKYLALELDAAPAPAWLRDAYDAGPVVSSEWDVYVDVRGRRLVYVKTPCALNWRPHYGGAFFLHATPFSPEKLPPHRAQFGFENLDSYTFTYLRRSATECVFLVRLPDYPLSRLSTGQFRTRPRGEPSAAEREGELLVEEPSAGAARERAEREGELLVEEPEYQNVWSATFQIPLARSVWEVRASARGRGLEYVKVPCEPSDTKARFFLHVHPARRADLPKASAARGYANLDFAWRGVEGVDGVKEAGVVVEETTRHGGCRISAALPDFPIAFVRTGQFRDGVVTRRIWSVRIDFAERHRLGAGGPAGGGA